MNTMDVLNNEIQIRCPDTVLDYDDEQAFQKVLKHQLTTKRSIRMFASRSLEFPDVKSKPRRFSDIKIHPIVIPKPVGSF